MLSTHLVLPCVLSHKSNKISSKALIDTGASGFAFIDADFVSHNNLPQIPLPSPQKLEVIDGRPISSGHITHTTYLDISINGDTESASFYITKLGRYPIVLELPWMQHHDVLIKFGQNTVEFGSPFCRKHCLASGTLIRVSGQSPPPSIAMISAGAFHRAVRQRRSQVFALSLLEINSLLQQDLKAATPNISLQTIPPAYSRYLPMFEEDMAKHLQPPRPMDLKIELKEGTQAPFGPLYHMSIEELKILKAYISQNLSRGFIRVSSSSAASPVLFVKTNDGTLRLCVDYRALNSITKKDRYPLPPIRETLNRLASAKWYTKLDLRQGYHQLRMATGEEWKTAFRTRQGLYEYLVVPFRLTNAPAGFQKFVNGILAPYLDDFCTAYIDDTLVYSATLEEHRIHVQKVLEALYKEGILLKPEKCEFDVQSTRYLGYVLSSKGLEMDPVKTKTIREWKRPKSVHDVQMFLGFANFYRRYIRGYSIITRPLTGLTGKEKEFIWDGDHERAFKSLKTAFTTAPVLQPFDFEKRCVVETDASDFVSARVLSQPDLYGVLHPVAFFSKKHTPAECNYEIYDNELLAVVRAFEEWRPELEGAAYPVEVLSDHRNLEYFISKQDLNRRQARWSTFLSRFDYKIQYRPGRVGLKPDAVTRRSEDLPLEGDLRLLNQSQTILKRENLGSGIYREMRIRDGLSGEEGLPVLAVAEVAFQPPHISTDNYTSFAQEVLVGYENDLVPRRILLALKNGIRMMRELSIGECGERNNLLY